MSSVVSKNYQIGADGTATNNFTIRQPATPDGTVRIANGNTGSTTDLVTLTSAGNLGVGTSSPGRKLDVYGAGQFKDASGIANTIWSEFSTGIAGIGTNNNYPLALVTNGTQKALLDTSGNLGLGVTPSAWSTGDTALQIRNGAGIAVSATPNLSLFRNSYESATGWKYYANGYASLFNIESDGAFKFFTAPSGTAGNAISFTQAMTLDSSGNLLVGTTSSASGNSNTFQVAGTSATDVAVFARSTTNSANVRCVIASAPNYAGDNGYFFIGSRSTGDRFYVLTSGNVQNTNNSYGAISDVKVKENITDATPKLNKLQQVRVVNYNLIGDTQKQIGVVAQELEQIFPGMVEETPDRDAEGNDLGTTTKSVKYSVFVPMLIKAMQEQQTLIQDQLAIITALTARVEALEAAKV